MAQDASRHLYGHLTEDTLYILRDCSYAKEIWNQVIPSNRIDSFFVGGVIRDDRGQWVLGYNRPLGKCTVTVAELWGIFDGLLLLQKQGYAEVADAFAKMALTRSETLHMFEEPPLVIKEILKEDSTFDNMSRI
ncbi:hypothetical protein J1N35_028454 [Gossypium stocksii]|uniref:RNase H type-1 domain-containing protein n=1 Tax=Gossypium stocksii TaxID=47602 RepID=A0A9D3UW02_9ROSI|nr:hypothetical protein J1N35_028454 [Gossypium stocksii]